MYRARIKTKYNIIELSVQDINDPDFQEIIDQPYVSEVYIEKQKPNKEGQKILRKAKNGNN